MSSMYSLKSESIIHDIIEGEAVVMNLETGVYYSFNAPATQIWSSISDGNSTQSEILQLAGTKNKVFVQFLVDQELIVLTEMSESASGKSLEKSSISETAEWQTFSDMKDLLLLDPVHDIALGEKGWPERFPDN